MEQVDDVEVQDKTQTDQHDDVDDADADVDQVTHAQDSSDNQRKAGMIFFLPIKKKVIGPFITALADPLKIVIQPIHKSWNGKGFTKTLQKWEIAGVRRLTKLIGQSCAFVQFEVR
jgi:hypothetical protein